MSAEPVPPDFADLFAKIAAAFRYDDSIRWFDATRLRFVEAVNRGTKPTVFAFVYEPTGRHLFLDDRGRTYRFTRPADPTKSMGTFSLSYGGVGHGIEALRPPPPTTEPGSCFWNEDFFDDIDDLRCSTACYGDGMRREITQRELRNQSGEIMRALDNGDEFVITRNGVPVGELRPFRRRQFTPTDEFLEAMRGAPQIDYQRWRADVDRYVDQDPTPRG